MAKHIVTETRPAIQVWVYEVEAESQTEALNKVIDGGADVSEHYVEEQWSEEGDTSYFDVEEEKE
jgi:hypothetical protein